mgnify:CR=1 FL=1
MKGTKISLSREDRVFMFTVYAIGLLLLLTVAYPLVYVVSASLSDPMQVIGGQVVLLPKAVSIKAYQEVFRSGDIMTGYRNTIAYTMVGTLINMAMTTIAAYPLSRPDMAGRNLITMLISFTMFFSGGMIPTFLTIKNLGLLNTFWVMVLPGAISVTNLLIMRNYFQHSVPNEIIEAAYVDGCTNIGTLLRVVIPISQSIFGVLLIYYFVGHWNSYFNALLYLNDRSRYPLQVFLRQILLQNSLADMASGTSGDSQAEVALLSETLKYAVIVTASVPALVLYPFMQKFFAQGIMIGSIKG